MYLCSCYGPSPEPLYCGCAGPVPPAACASPHSAALRLRGGAPPSLITVFVIGPDYHRSGPAQVVLHPLATLEQLAAAVLDIYFGRGRVPPVELRLMPSNIILAEGFTLLYSSLLTLLYPANTLITEAGVVDRSVVQLYFLPPSEIPTRAPPMSPTYEPTADSEPDPSSHGPSDPYDAQLSSADTQAAVYAHMEATTEAE